MTFEQKRCVFCEKFVPARTAGDRLVFRDCYCCPGGSYSVEEKLYDRIRTMSPMEKREHFFPISGLIRETLTLGREMDVNEENLPALLASPLIPQTMEDKLAKCLLYLYRLGQGPERPVEIRPIDHAYNITYSPSLQEFVYIIEELKEKKWLERRGAIFHLTQAGWRQAVDLAENAGTKQCFFALPEGETGDLFHSEVLPQLREKGYQAILVKADASGCFSLQKQLAEIKGCDLVIADFTGSAPMAYSAAAFSKALGKKAVYTVHSGKEAGCLLAEEDMVPIVWENAEDLVDKLLLRLSGRAPVKEHS